MSQIRTRCDHQHTVTVVLDPDEQFTAHQTYGNKRPVQVDTLYVRFHDDETPDRARATGFYIKQDGSKGAVRCAGYSAPDVRFTDLPLPVAEDVYRGIREASHS